MKKNTIKLSSIDLKNINKGTTNKFKKKTRPKNQVSIKMIDYMIF
ncbi:hypothetical protein [Clostridium sp. Marseille-Q2269]|nr:hypothetical protein [Clostridium sp. Marseille-Q2269]